MTPEQEQQLLQRVTELENKIGKLNYPIDPDSQGAIEGVLFKQLKALVIRAGLPIYFTTARDVVASKPLQVEMWMESLSGSPKIVSYINGTRYYWTAD